MNGPDRVTGLAAEVLRRAGAAGETLAVAESLTGGLLCARLVDVPGASAVLRGGVVAYVTELKTHLLGVDAELLARVGAVDGDVAVQMAAGAAQRLGASRGVATTGVAGPRPQDGRPVGTVYVATWARGNAQVRRLRLDGDRAAIRHEAVEAALMLLLDTPAGTP